MSDVTVVITACDRLDLLERTLRSFLQHNTYPITNYLIRDDSGLQDVWFKTSDLMSKFRIPYFIFNPDQVGQAQSIDMMMQMVLTPYVFHLEDDWEFTRPGFIEDCLKVFDDDVSQVWVRSRNDGVAVKPGKEIERDGVKANIVEGRFSFNPHLRHSLSFGKFAGYKEKDLGEIVSERGLRVLWLQEGACHHIGGHKTTNRPGTPYEHGVKKA